MLRLAIALAMSRLTALWKRIEHNAQVVGDVIARAILTVLYVLFAIPVGLLMRFDADALDRSWQRGGQTHWKARAPEDDSLRGARGQG